MDPKNLCEFPEGSVVRSIYSGKVYVITKHYANGMCNLFCQENRYNENWNACNNRHFILADSISTAVTSLLINL